MTEPECGPWSCPFPYPEDTPCGARWACPRCGTGYRLTGPKRERPWRDWSAPAGHWVLAHPWRDAWRLGRLSPLREACETRRRGRR